MKYLTIKDDPAQLCIDGRLTNGKADFFVGYGIAQCAVIEINKQQAQQIIEHLQKVFDLNDLITTTNPRPDGGIDTLTVPLSCLSSEKVK